MSRRCDLTGIGAQTGHKVSHSNHKSKRRFTPNLQNISFLSNILGRKISLRVTPATVRTVDHNGGIDSYLLATSNLKLTDTAKKIKRKLKKVLLETNPDALKATPKDINAKRPVKAKRPAKKTPEQKAEKKKATTKRTALKKSSEKTKPVAKPATAKKEAVKKSPAKAKAK